MTDKKILGLLVTAIGFWMAWEGIVWIISNGQAFVGAI